MQLAMALRAMVRLLIGGELMSTLGGGSRGGECAFVLGCQANQRYVQIIRQAQKVGACQFSCAH